MNRLFRPLLYVAFLGAAVSFILTHAAGAKSASRALYVLDGYWVAAAVFAQILCYIAGGGLVRATVQLSGKSVTLILGILILLASNTIGTLGAGFVGTAGTSYHWIRGTGLSPKAAALVGWLPPIFYNVVLVGLSNWGLAVLLFRHELTSARLAMFVLLELVVILLPFGLYWSVTHQAIIQSLIERILNFSARLRRRELNSRLLSMCLEWIGSIGLLMGGNWHTPMLWAVLSTGLDIVTLGLLFRAVQFPISASVLLAGYALPQLLGGILMIPGGVGALEISMIAIYTILDIPGDVGIVVVLSYRVISFWIPTLLGLAAVPYLERVTGSKG